MSSAQFERQVGYLVALELYEDNPSLTLMQAVDLLETELFKLCEPLISWAELQGMQCFYRYQSWQEMFAA